MPKTQPKVIYKAPQKKILYKKSADRIAFLPFSLTLVLVMLLTIIGIELVTSPYATASQTQIASPTARLYASDLLVSPSPTPDISIPVVANLEKSLKDSANAETATDGATFEDYCVDVPVVMYHHVQPLAMAELLGHKALTVDSDIFDEQIKYLSENGYTALDAHDLAYALQTKSQLPEKSIVITIDDGYDDNYTYAFLSAKKYNFVINFMIPTGLIGTSGYMQWEHLQELKDNPYATIYNHSTSHAPLGYLTKDRIIEEVTTANNELSSHLGLENKIVTYPYGAYSDEAIATLKELDMTAAFSTDSGTTHCLSTIMRLPRIRIGNAPMSSYGF